MLRKSLSFRDWYRLRPPLGSVLRHSSPEPAVRASVLLLVSTFMIICRFLVSLCWLLMLILCRVVKEDKGFFLEICSCNLAKPEVTWSFLSIALCSYSFRFPMWYLLMCVCHQIPYSCWSLQVWILLSRSDFLWMLRAPRGSKDWLVTSCLLKYMFNTNCHAIVSFLLISYTFFLPDMVPLLAYS
jgi:hypothetical protein